MIVMVFVYAFPRLSYPPLTSQTIVIYDSFVNISIHLIFIWLICYCRPGFVKYRHYSYLSTKFEMKYSKFLHHTIVLIELELVF